MAVERYGNEHILPKSFIDKMEDDIKELSKHVLTDTDRTNIYSYRGTDFKGDLQTYLKGAGYDVRTVDIVNGYIWVLRRRTHGAYHRRRSGGRL